MRRLRQSRGDHHRTDVEMAAVKDSTVSVRRSDVKRRQMAIAKDASHHQRGANNHHRHRPKGEKYRRRLHRPTDGRIPHRHQRILRLLRKAERIHHRLRRLQKAAKSLHLHHQNYLHHRVKNHRHHHRVHLRLAHLHHGRHREQTRSHFQRRRQTQRSPPK